MRRAEPLEPEVEAALEAIDATLAGEPVDPEHAELAELSLILRCERPLVPEAFAATMDARVRDRFGPLDDDDGGSARRSRWRRLWGWVSGSGWLAPAGAVAAIFAVIIVLVSVTGGGGSSSSSTGPVRDISRPARNASASAATASAGGAQAPPKTNSLHSGSQSGQHLAPVPTNPSGRQIVQGAQLALSTRPGRIDSVSQQVFDVTGSEKGYVASSSVTATGHPDSSATFQLSVPSANLQDTLTQLSQLHGASVVSSTNTSRDITGEVGGAGRRLAEARALRRSLLRQLAAAFTTDQIDALKSRISRVDRTIDRDQAALNSLHQQVRYSRIALTIEGSAPPPSGHHGASGGGFTLGRAGHDALHVLVVAAGVLLIALAVAIPVAIVASLLSWLWWRARRRSREAALDRA
jgi:Domain of unknown function (DUF4349)